MARRSTVIVLLVAVLSVAVLSVAGMNVAVSDVPQPDIQKGQGESCVAETDFIRRNHMDLLKHQRDETMIQGIRSEPYSLKDCVACHAVNGADGVPVTAASSEHFCRSCHDYAAVKIDCFECHASRAEME